MTTSFFLTQKMIFVLLDDNTLSVHSDEKNLHREYEAIDIENGEYSFFDSSGYELIPTLDPPTVKRKILGFIPFSLEGNIILTRGDLRREELLNRLSTIARINDNPWFKSISDVQDFLKKQNSLR